MDTVNNVSWYDANIKESYMLSYLVFVYLCGKKIEYFNCSAQSL